MITDGRTVEADGRVRADVCVVGAGPAGLALAHALDDAGVRTVVVEAGGRTTVRAEDTDDPVSSIGLRYRVGRSRGFGIGGTAGLWDVTDVAGTTGYGRLLELEPHDFEARSWITLSGWPIARSDLDPAYRRARALLDIRRRPTPPAPVDPAGDGPRAEARTYDFVRGSSFADRIHRRLAASRTTTLLVHATVTDIRVDAHRPDAVSALRVVTGRGTRFEVVARTHVLATGGIQNPRLLLAARDHHPAGIGNAHDLVGRYFMDHPHFEPATLLPADPARLAGLGVYGVHEEDGWTVQRKLVLDAPTLRRHRLPGCVFYLERRAWTPNLLAERLGWLAASDFRIGTGDGTGGGHPGRGARRSWGEQAGRLGRLATRAGLGAGRRLGLGAASEPRLLRVHAVMEQVPNRHSRVVLGTSRDAFGVPTAALDWRLTDQDVDGMFRSLQALPDPLTRVVPGVLRTHLRAGELPRWLRCPHHHMGTTRMDDSPRRGVVDADCRVHGMRNLYVVGSSVFPTGGYANPTLTIVALALRLADHLVARPVVRVDPRAALR